MWSAEKTEHLCGSAKRICSVNQSLSLSAHQRQRQVSDHFNYRVVNEYKHHVFWSENSPKLPFFSVSSSSVTEAGNQLVAQEAVRKPSTLRRPPARSGDATSSKIPEHVETFDKGCNGARQSRFVRYLGLVGGHEFGTAGKIHDAWFIFMHKHVKLDFLFIYLLFFSLDCLNCSRITALSDRLNSLETKVWTVLRIPEKCDMFS